MGSTKDLIVALVVLIIMPILYLGIMLVGVGVSAYEWTKRIIIGWFE